MSQLIIVTTPQNSGLGTPLATAFDYTNQNFGELYARAQANPPATLIGQPGDVAGMYAYDSTYFYYCFQNYTGNSAVWAQITQVGNIAVSQIQSGTSNVAVVGPSANVTVGINGTSNVAVFAATGVYVKNNISAVGNIKGSYILGNGSQLTGLPQSYTDANVVTLLSNFGSNTVATTGNVSGGNLLTLGTVSASGNVSGNYILGNGSQLTGLPALYGNSNVTALLSSLGSNNISSTGTITAGNITGGNLVTTGAVSSTGNIVSQGNIKSQGVISAVGNIVTSGYFVGTFVGNVTGNFVIPGANTQVVFNTNGNADAVGGMTYNKDSNTFTVLGVVSSQGNVIAGNLTTTGQVSATGNITGGNVSATNITGTLTTASQTNITTVGTLGSLSVSGNVNGGNLKTTGVVSAAGNIIGGNVNATAFFGTTVSATGSVLAANVSASGNVTGGNLVGTVATASQPSITSLGTLTSLSVSGNVQGGNINTAGAVSVAGNISGGNLTIGNVNAGGTIVATTVDSATASMTGNVTGGNIFTGGQVSAAGNVTGNYFLGNVALASGFPATYGNANVVTLLAGFGSNTISTTGNVTAGAFNTSGSVLAGAGVSVAGNVDVGGNINGSLSSTVFINNTQNATGVATGALQVAGGASINKDLWVVGNIYAGNISGVTANIITVEDPLLYLYAASTYPYNYDIGFYSHFTGGTGNTYQHTGLVRDFNDNTWKLFSNVSEPTLGVVTFNGNTVYDAFKSGPITAVGAVSATGTVSGSGLSVGTGTVTLGNIVNANGNGVGNIGSSGTYFDTVFAKATSAQYADLAENYMSDSAYEPGTVVVFGGEHEITACSEFGDERVAGVISTDPAYLMNSGMNGLPVALRGRVPVKVVGPVTKGDSLVTSSTVGQAISVGRDRSFGQAVFAKALETNLSDGEKVITAVIV